MTDLVRVGYISAINYADGTAQVTYKDRDNAVSPYMPFASNEFFPPDIDTLVYVIHLPNGGTRGMILPAPYTEGNRPREGKKGIWRKDFGDGSYLRYDYNSKLLEIAADSVKMTDVYISGNLSVAGNIKTEGSITAASLSVNGIKTTGNVDIGGNLTVAGSYPMKVVN